MGRDSEVGSHSRSFWRCRYGRGTPIFTLNGDTMSIVVIVALALAAGLIVGYAKHGRLRRLASPPPVRNRLLLTALGLYIVAVFASWAWESALPVLSALSWFVVAFYAWLNRWMPGARLVALGLVANALVLLVNSSVPISPSAAERAGVEISALEGPRTEPTNSSTRLAWLAKSIPVAFPPRPEVVSPGDIAVAAGLATVVATGMTGRRPATSVLPARRRTSRYTDDVLDDERHDNAGHGPVDDDTQPEQPAVAATVQHAPDDDRARMRRRQHRDTTQIRRHASA